MDICADIEATKAGSSSVQDKISSIESDSEATKAGISSVQDKISSIESELGITSKNVVGNTSHPQYAQLQHRYGTLTQQLSTKESTLLTLNQRLTLLAKDQVRGESSVMGGYNQFAELVLTCYTWTAVTVYSHVVTGYKQNLHHSLCLQHLKLVQHRPNDAE